MTAFSAVRTTGIYCRPGCAGRPDPRNVEPFELAAAAEASGYRACLRCRPYRSEPPLPWGGPELVCRAVRLVVAGALDGRTEADLGSRLGMSPRHLRRLFVTHLGVTPDQLARSRRSHFARRLLDDTDLTVTEIAFAAGFGSVRQLNRACAQIFRASPVELRRRRRSSDRLVADGGLTVRLGFIPPFDAMAVLTYLSNRAFPGVERVGDGAYRRTVAVDGDPGAIEILPGGDDHLLLRAHLPHWEGLIHLVHQVRAIPNLDLDGHGVNRALATDPVIGPLIAARPGLRVPGAWDPFEVGVRAIIGQQLSVGTATRVGAQLVERLGQPVAGLGSWGLTHLFPTPVAVAEGDLHGFGLTGARQTAVRNFAAAVVDGHFPLDGSAALEELVGSLTALPGIGPWTAQYIALRSGEPDAFPAGDLGLLRAAAGLGLPDSPSRLAGVAERWRPWRAHAAMHLWAAGAQRTSAAASPARRRKRPVRRGDAGRPVVG